MDSNTSSSTSNITSWEYLVSNDSDDFNNTEKRSSISYRCDIYGSRCTGHAQEINNLNVAITCCVIALPNCQLNACWRYLIGVERGDDNDTVFMNLELRGNLGGSIISDTQLNFRPGNLLRP